jgi:archaeosine-15-forming tRNA-guanine transglycosylase
MFLRIFFCRKGRHVFCNVVITALEHVRCYTPDENNSEYEITGDKGRILLKKVVHF